VWCVLVNIIFRGENVRHNVGCRNRNLDDIFVTWRKCFTCSISYCKDNIKCDSASNVPICPLNNDGSIVQKHVVKLSNISTMFSQQVKIRRISEALSLRKKHFSFCHIYRREKHITECSKINYKSNCHKMF